MGISDVPSQWRPDRVTFILGILLACAALFLVYSVAKPAQTKLVEVFQPLPVVVPNRQTVSDLPSGSQGAFKVLRDVSVFDLQYWRAVPPDKLSDRFSPALYSNVLLIKKVKPGKWFSAHYATSGAGIDLKCVSHPAKAFDKPKSAAHEKDASYEYGLLVDLEGVQIGQEVVVVIEGIYWNGFRGVSSESASTYTEVDYDKAEDLQLIIVAPPQKPIKMVRLLSGPSDSDKRTPFAGRPDMLRDPLGAYVRWSVHDLLPAHHYTMEWDW